MSQVVRRLRSFFVPISELSLRLSNGESAISRMAASITQLTLCQVSTEKTEAATKLFKLAANYGMSQKLCLSKSQIRKSLARFAFHPGKQQRSNKQTGPVENQNRFRQKFTRSYLINTKRKRKVHEVSKPMASLSLIPFPFALHSLSSSRLAVTHGHHKPKQGREVSYTNSSQFHKVSP